MLLAFLGLADLMAASVDEQTSLDYWLSNVPVRLMFLFGLTGYVYLFKEDGMLGARSTKRSSTGELLQNSLVFAWAFMELATWFWVSCWIQAF